MTDQPILPWRYRHSGLLVASQIELAAWEAFRTDDDAPAEVTIALADQPCPDRPANGITTCDAEGARFAIDGVGGWQVQGGQRILLHPALTADPRELQLFTLGSAWGLLGYQRGQAMWHGSAVELDGRCVLFCGEAGEGKSTMAVAMLVAGARLVADDLSRIVPDKNGARIFPSSSRIKLWREAIDEFGWEDRIIERDWMRDDKYHCSVPSHRAGAGPVKLDAVVVLHSGKDIELQPLGGSAALTEVLAGTIYRPEALEAMGRWGEQGALAARIVSQLSVWKLRRPRDLGELQHSVDEVSAMLDSLG